MKVFKSKQTIKRLVELPHFCHTYTKDYITIEVDDYYLQSTANIAEEKSHKDLLKYFDGYYHIDYDYDNQMELLHLEKVSITYNTSGDLVTINRKVIDGYYIEEIITVY